MVPYRFSAKFGTNIILTIKNVQNTEILGVHAPFIIVGAQAASNNK